MSPSADRNSVLLIDDDPSLRDLVAAIAEVSDVPLLVASNCVQGLKVLEAESVRIKLILLDYFMPGMQPAKCAAAILARAGLDIPVVLLTAAPDPAARAAELHIHRWISKPFEISTMTEVLTETTPRKAA